MKNSIWVIIWSNSIIPNFNVISISYWPVGYADNVKVWNYAITPDNDPDGIFHGKTPDAGDALAVGSDNNLTPDVYELSQNYPNPFNPTTTFDLSMTKSQVVDFAKSTT